MQKYTKWVEQVLELQKECEECIAEAKDILGEEGCCAETKEELHKLVKKEVLQQRKDAEKRRFNSERMQRSAAFDPKREDPKRRKMW